ncbi:hypothetical protein CU044_1221 [Streptomyces sp. L-9-10]|nr:hypothetical protein CU044_1221 [Streptomyces sp. L-9-10]
MFLPDTRSLQHSPVPGPLLGVCPGLLQVRIESGRISHIEIRQFKRLCHERAAFPDSSGGFPSCRDLPLAPLPHPDHKLVI